MSEKFQASFRDPQGSVLKYKHRIFRFIDPSYDDEIQETTLSNKLKNLIEQKYISSFEKLTKKDIEKLIKDDHFFKIYKKYNSNIVLEHKVIDFASYAYEWSNTMLFDAANLTLNLFEKVLSENLGLKDATPFNILFDKASPIFVDLLSFEKREECDPIWLAYSQFATTFLLPLLANKFAHVPIHKTFLSNTDGLEIKDCLKNVNYFHPISYSLILLPHFLSRFTKSKHYQAKKTKNPDFAKFILSRLIKKTKKRLKTLKPKIKDSIWSDYMQTNSHYEKLDFSIKEKFIVDILYQSKPKKVLDIGCNTGHFSILAAKSNAKVVSLDNDHEVIDRLYNRAKLDKLNILPLVVNICKPTPSIGWKNQEYSSFIDRSNKYFDLVFMLALIHHMQVSERVPLEEIASLASNLTKDGLIIEYVDPKDPMFQKIVRGREHLHLDITIETFKKIFEEYFKIIKEQKVNKTRSIFYMRKK